MQTSARHMACRLSATVFRVIVPGFLILTGLPSMTPGVGTALAQDAGSGWSAQVAPSGDEGIALDQAQREAVQKVSDYFNELKSLQGKFIQTGADGKAMRGKFKMQRPGRFRFDYARPSRQVIISDGRNLAIQDLDLGNEDRVALDQTPFQILLRKDVDLVRDAQIIEVQSSDKQILLAIRDKNPEASGMIRLVLNTSPTLELSEWTTTDAQGLDTRVQIGRLTRDASIPAEKFVIPSIFNPFDR